MMVLTCPTPRKVAGRRREARVIARRAGGEDSRRSSPAASLAPLHPTTPAYDARLRSMYVLERNVAD